MHINVKKTKQNKKAETQARARRNFIFPFVPKLMFDERQICTAKVNQQRIKYQHLTQKELRLQGCMVFAILWEYEILCF